jgi:hypothetical protein
MMGKKIWVKVDNNNRYDDYKSEWKLGTIVGTTRLPYQERYSFKAMLEVPNLTKQYLIELDDGKVIEAWYFDTYDLAPSNELESSDE